MAIRTTGVRYDLIAKDSASKVFGKIERSARGLDGGMGALARSVAKTGAVLGTGLAAGLAVSAEKAVRFEATMRRVQTQAGATAKDVSTLSKQVLELGKTTQQGPQKLAEALYHLKSVGMDNAFAMKSLKVASDLAAVGGANLEETTNALAGAWRSGIKGADTFGKAAASVNAIIGAGNMTMQDFTEAIGTGILPSAKSFGLSLNQVGAALALMTDEGIPAVDAATRLRMSFSLLGAPSAAADKQLKKIGLSGLDLAKAMRGPDGLIGAVTVLKDHLDKSGLSAERQSQILSRSFGGGRSSSGILTLLNNLDVLRQKQDQVNKSMGKFPAAVVAQRKTAEAQLKLLESNLQVLEIQVGTKVLPVLSGFVQFITRTGLPAIHGFGDDLAHKFIPVDQIKAGISTVQGFVEDFIGGFSPKAPRRKTVTLPAPTVKLAGGPISPFVKAPGIRLPSPTLEAPRTPIPGTLKVAAPVKSQAQKLGEELRAAFSGGIGDAIGRIDWGQLGSKLGQGLGTAFQWVTTHLADITKKLEKALGGIDWVDVGKSVGGQALGFAVGFVASFGADLFSPGFWEHHWWDVVIAAFSFIGVGKIAGPLEKVISKIPILRAFSPLLRGVEKVGKPLGDAAGKVMRFFGSSLWKGLAKVFPEGTAALERESGLFTTRVGVWGLRLLEAGGKAIRGLGNGIKAGFGWVLSKIGEGIGQMLRPFVAAGGWLVKRGGEFVGGLTRGIAGGAARLGGWVSEHVVSPATGAFRGAGGWLVGRGQAFVRGLKDGAVSIAKNLGGWAKTNIVDKVTGAFTGAKNWLTSAGGDVIRGLTSGALNLLNDAKNGVMHWAGTIKDKIVGAIKHVFGIRSPSRVMAQLGGHMMSGLLKGLLSGKDILNAAVKGIFHSPLDAAKTLIKNGINVIGFLGKDAAKLSSQLFSSVTQDITGGGAAATSGSAQSIGKKMMLAMGWGPDQWPYLKQLWNNESGWRVNALNPSSGAYGIPQALPASKMASAGADWRTNAATQIAWGLQYIKQRYGSPGSALSEWMGRSPHWYAKGGLAPFGQTAWVGERGPELMQVTSKGTRIFSNADSMTLAGALGMAVPGYARGTVSLGAARGDVAAAQRRVTVLEQQIASLRRDEAFAHSKAQRRRDRLAIMAEEERLKAARTELMAARKQLTAAEGQAKRVQGIANALQNGFLRTLETGSAAAIASAIKSLNSRLQTAGFGGLVAGNLRTSSRLQALAGQRASIQAQIAAANQYASDQGSGLGDFLNLNQIPASSLSSLISRLQNKQTLASNFASEVSSLSSRGLSKLLLGQLAEAGPGSQLAALLSKASAGDIAQLNKLAASQQKLTVSFGRTMADAMYDSGAQAGRGFLSGLQAQEKAIQAEMNRLAAGMVSTIKKKLGIHSPSTVTRDEIGRPFALGAALGVRQYAPVAHREAQRMADTMAAVRARGGVAVAVGAGGGQVVHHTEHHTHYEINARSVDMTPQQLEVVQRKVEARERFGRPR